MKARARGDERYRHECEVRWLIRKFIAERAARGKAKAAEAVERYLRLVAEKRKHDPSAADRLRTDAREQIMRGNRGEDGDWRE